MKEIYNELSRNFSYGSFKETNIIFRNWLWKLLKIIHILTSQLYVLIAKSISVIKSTHNNTVW